MKLTPLADNVVLKRFEAEEKTASGIILSTANKEKSALCEVVAVGPGKKDEPMTVKVGQKVLTAKFGGRRSSSTSRTIWSASSATFWQLWNKAVKE